MKTRNRQWDLMRAIGIIAVVWHHSYQPPYIFFPASYFHMSLLFFVSGYFFTPKPTFKEKAGYFLRKTQTLAIPYIALNIIFGLITMYLKNFGINLGNDLNFHTIVIAPFEGGGHFHLFLAAWFIVNLYVISLVAGLLYTKNKLLNIAILSFSVGLLLSLLSFIKNPGDNNWIAFSLRSLFGFCFFSFGYVLKTYEPYVYKYLIKPGVVLGLFIVITVLEHNLGSISYSILTGQVGNTLVFVPIISSICIILIVYAITYYVTNSFKGNSFFYTIGEHTYSIMAWHLTIFFLVNVVLYHMGIIPFTALNDVYYKYNVDTYWLLYQIPAIIVPVFMAIGLTAFMRKYFVIKSQ